MFLVTYTRSETVLGKLKRIVNSVIRNVNDLVTYTSRKGYRIIKKFCQSSHIKCKCFGYKKCSDKAIA